MVENQNELFGDRQDPRPAIGESVAANIPIEYISAWPHATWRNWKRNGDANILVPGKREKSDLPGLVDGNNLHNEMPYSAGEYIHLPIVGGGELSGVTHRFYPKIVPMVLDTANPDVDVSRDTWVDPELVANARWKEWL